VVWCGVVWCELSEEKRDELRFDGVVISEVDCCVAVWCVKVTRDQESEEMRGGVRLDGVVRSEMS
jgi:hypothetical protein